MTWTNILAPVLGADADDNILMIAKSLAAPFGATVTAAYAPSSPTDRYSWMNEYGIGISAAVLDELQRVAGAGETGVRERVGTLGYPHVVFENATGEEWMGLRNASRLADVAVWDWKTAQGQGYLSQAFQQILMDERRPALIAKRPIEPGGTAVIAWDGGREASRAARRAIPWLQKADQVLVLTAPQAMANPCEPTRLLSYLAANKVLAEPMALHSRGEAGPLILETVGRVGATLLVAGAFGHPRLQRFIFGGTTQVLLESAPSALFLSH